MNTTNAKIAVLGAGSWGTALAIQLARRHPVSLWGHQPAAMDKLAKARANQPFLPDIPFPPKLQVTSLLEEAIADAAEVLVVVPSHAFAQICQRLAQQQPPVSSLSWATKGFDPGSSRLLSEVAKEYLPQADLAVISGPTFAHEVASGLPTAMTVAATDRQQAACIAQYLQGDHFRVYTTDDLIGVQVGSACKNVLAIAAGIADGLGFGANARAALITRGLAEITRLGLALGGRAETFTGLAGLGDLVLTCTDNQSRNRRMGLALAEQPSVEQARATIGQEVEGIHTAREVWLKAQALGVDMPITEQTYRVLYAGLAPREAVDNLLHREARTE